MSFENEQDVDNVSESSSEVTEQITPDSTPAETSEALASDSAESKAKEPDVPFHMHPRFQEVIQEKNAFKEQLQQQARQLQELQGQLKRATPAERDELMERLEGIDPKFAGMLKGMRGELQAAKQQLEEFSAWRNQSSAQSAQQQVESLKNQFYTENKIPTDRRAIYEALAVTEAQKNPNLQISDLPKVMKQVHDSVSKLFQGVERTTAKNMVVDKKGNAAKPAPLSKGAPAKNAQKQDKDAPQLSAREIRDQMLKEVLDDVRAGKDI